MNKLGAAAVVASLVLVLPARTSAQGHYFFGRTIREGLGIRCAVDGGGFSPPSYRVADLNKRAVPRLSKHDLRELRTILKYVPSPTLRFAMVRNSRGADFVVFDAVDRDLCGATTASEFFVLNGACNEYYYPAEYGDRTNAAPDCWEPPRPWIPDDGGLGTGSW